MIARYVGITREPLYIHDIRTMHLVILDLGHIAMLQEDNCPATRLEQVDLTSIQEEFGRLAILGAHTKANLPMLARSSLDDALRNSWEPNELVKDIPRT